MIVNSSAPSHVPAPVSLNEQTIWNAHVEPRDGRLDRKD